MVHSKAKKQSSCNTSAEEKQDERFISFIPNSITRILAILSFIIASISSVYYNNSVFKGIIKFPVFVSCIQQFIGIIIMSTVALIKKMIKKIKEDELIEHNKSKDVSSLAKLIYAAPVAFFFSFNISFNNICLTHGKVSTYAMAKSTTLMWSLLLQYILLGIKVKLTSLISCIIIISGVLISAFDPKSLFLKSLIYGCISSFSQSCYNITLKWILPKVNNDSVSLLKYVQLFSVIFFFIPMFGTGELIPAFTTSGCFDFNDPRRMIYLWGIIAISAILAICVNQSTYIVIGLTTPATFNVCGLVKQALQTLGGVVYLGEKLSYRTLVSVCLTFCGSASYTITNHFISKPKVTEEEQKIIEEKYKEIARNSIGTASDVFENAQDDIINISKVYQEIIPLKNDIEQGLSTSRSDKSIH
ncbi:hypothetical protein cand_034050 [Cryptosporidium andersoni]|uniref:Sugar phosphate transporter domain-containing protein n=1 Tax=Cryptosporidium andersoni TaxID=117008 RepID=A0A1J4MXU3_9CRYT|nr:hypothetical protein cand_034050 [Cryptosporidium andersoni]